MIAAMKVLKFGGTSVADVAAFRRVVGIVRAHGGARPAVVVSAMSGMTDALLAAVAAAGGVGGVGRDLAGALRSLDAHLERHRDVARRLLGPAAAGAFGSELDSARWEIAELLQRLGSAPAGARRPALQDEVVSYGERLSATLLAAVLTAAGLRARYVDARRCIVTDETHGRATPLFPEIERRIRAELLPLLERGELPVLGGYIGASERGLTTTLGRGGSDYTAALVGAALGAGEIQIWTDVSGVLTADPRLVPAARTIPRLSYAEAAELAYFGAKVLHPKTIQPALERQIPVRICNSRAPDGPETLVTAEADVWPGAVKSIAHKTGITVVQVTSARMLGAYGFLRALFEIFDRHRTAVDVVTTSEVSVSLTVEDGDALPLIVKELKSLGEVAVERGRAMICVVGEGLRTTPGIAARVFHTIRDINVSLVSQGASRVNLTFVVDGAQVQEAVVRLHAALLEGEGSGVEVAVVHGPTADPIALARRLIDIPSVSGDEGAVARFLAAHLEGLGYQVELFDAAPGRPNLLATTGVGAPPRIVFSTHLDTVAPHIASHEDAAYLYGRGACDAKGIIAAQVAAVERLRAAGISEIGLLFVVDEEQGSLGARAANGHPRGRDCRYLIVGEPTDNQLAIGSKGSLRLTIRAQGSGGHSSYPERGTSAIDRLLAVLADIRACEWPRDEFLGETTCNIGVIAGGTAPNVLAGEAQADLQIRLVTDPVPVRETLERVVGSRAQIEYLSATPPVRLTAVPGFESCVVAFTTDIAHLSNWGTPLLHGPGSIHDAHTTSERIAKVELETGIELYVRLARTLLAGMPSGPPGAMAAGTGAGAGAVR